MSRSHEKWCSFHISANTSNDSTSYIHRIAITQRPGSRAIPCCSIKMRSVFDSRPRTVETVELVDASECEIRRSLPLKGSGRPFPSRFFIELRQTPKSKIEEFGFTIPDGANNVYEASCRLVPMADDEDALCYIASHQDLIDAFGANATAGRLHYVRHGRAEGRETTFRPLSYVASHADLFILGLDKAKACRHFILHGHKEGRMITFDPFVYLSGYADLIDRIPPEEDKIVDHYISTGFDEGRRCKPFPWVEYLKQNPDISSTMEFSQHAAARHYVLSGYRENRILRSSGDNSR